MVLIQVSETIEKGTVKGSIVLGPKLAPNYRLQINTDSFATKLYVVSTGTQMNMGEKKAFRAPEQKQLPDGPADSLLQKLHAMYSRKSLLD